MALWSKVVTNPLGLSGFALFLVFSCLSWYIRTKKRTAPRWLLPTAVTLACITLIGGMTLAYLGVAKSVPPSVQTNKSPQSAPQQSNSNVRQETSGPGSPAVQGTQGDVNINVDQSTGKSEPQKQPVKKSKPGTN